MDCVLCEDPITNPLCPECLAEGVSQWLGGVAPEKLEDLHRETDSLHADYGVQCIRCTNPFVVCTYCYTKNVFNMLKEGKLQVEFLEYFDFLSQNEY